MKVKIVGAGSIGCHMAHASRKCGWQVTLTDVNPQALARAREEIFPTRYGTWYQEIDLCQVDDEKEGVKYDLVIIGTPPETHLEIALRELQKKPKAMLIEKPISQPNMMFIDEFLHDLSRSETKCFVGYDHAISQSCATLSEILQKSHIETVDTIDVEFKESWDGILAAHPWLSGPEESYLGYTARGGGALCEHSHGLNLWQHFSRTLGLGRIAEVSAQFHIIEQGEMRYDKLASLNLVTEKGIHGRCVQDMFSKPTSKTVNIQTRDQGNFIWKCEAARGRDLIKREHIGNIEIQEFPKTRPQDFITELKHIDFCIKHKIENSPIDIMRGVETMCVISAAVESVKSGKTVTVNYPEISGA